MALAELRELCLRSGYRTTDLPTDAEMAARALEASGMADASSYVPPVPNAQEVMQADLVKLTNDSQPPSRIEDHRGTPAPPRDLPDRPYMNVPRLSNGFR